MNAENFLTKVAIYTDNSTPVEIEEAAETSRITTSAVFALISALGDGDKMDIIIQTIIDQQYKEFKDQGEYISNETRYVDTSSDTESIFQALHVEDSME